MNRPSRPPLYALEVGRRRRRRRRPSVRMPPLAAVAVVLLAVLAAGSAFVAYRLWPLTHRSAGYIGPPVASTPAPGGGTRPTTGVLRPLSAVGASSTAIPGVRISAGVVLDSASGTVLWEHEPHRSLPIASLTKLMTAYLAAPRSARGGGRPFAVTPAMVGVPGYVLGLHVGEQVTVVHMLAAALIASANDAANALAVHEAGSLRAFVARMNAAARRLGLTDTHYSNPSGIFDAGNHSSAWDVAELTRHVLQRQVLASLVGRRAYQVGNAVYVNRNRLLWTYHGAIGVKTGSTPAAGNCLAVAAVRHGRMLVAVVLHPRGGQFAVATRLLDWGFRHDG